MSRRPLSYANVTATVALAVALSTGAYAAVTLPKSSVGTTQLQKNAVTSPKIKNRTIRAADLRPAVLPPPTRAKTQVRVTQLVDPCGLVDVLHDTFTVPKPSNLLVISSGVFTSNSASYSNGAAYRVRLGIGDDALEVASSTYAKASSETNHQETWGLSGLLADNVSGKPYRLMPGTTYTIALEVSTDGECANDNAALYNSTLTRMLLAPG